VKYEHSPEEDPISAKELRAKIKEDPFYTARWAIDEEEIRRIQQAIDEFMQAAAPLFEELAQSGYPIDRLSDLYRKRVYANKSTFKKVVPILLRWLPRMDDLRVKEDIVRTLSVKWAKPVAAPVLIDEFLRAPDYAISSYKWAIGNALSVVADDSVFDDIVKLVQDKKHGKAREMVAVALGNMKNPLAVDVLIELLKDDEVAGHALIALGKLKSWKARPYIEPFLEHPKAWVRKEAKRALAKIDKAK
jgi:hypothetical protein